MALAVAAGEPLYGRKTKRGAVVYFSAADITTEFKRRMQAVTQHAKLWPYQLSDFHFADVSTSVYSNTLAKKAYQGKDEKTWALTLLRADEFIRDIEDINNSRLAAKGITLVNNPNHVVQVCGVHPNDFAQQTVVEVLGKIAWYISISPEASDPTWMVDEYAIEVRCQLYGGPITIRVQGHMKSGEEVDLTAQYIGATDMGAEEKALFCIEGTTRRWVGYNHFGKNPEKLVGWFDKYTI